MLDIVLIGKVVGSPRLSLATGESEKKLTMRSKKDTVVSNLSFIDTVKLYAHVENGFVLYSISYPLSCL